MESSADALRLKLFAPQEVKVVATNDFPAKLYGLVMDWAVGTQEFDKLSQCVMEDLVYTPRALCCPIT